MRPPPRMIFISWRLLDWIVIIMGMNSYESGLFAEFWARMYLRIHGYRILRSRYVTGRNTGRAEIDIIARRGKTIVFIEVKRRPTIAAGWDAITHAQATRLRRSAETFLAREFPGFDARFDVIIVCGLRIHHARGAI